MRFAGTRTFRAPRTWPGCSIRLPGYLKVPTPADTSFDAWMKRTTPTASKPAPWDSWNYYSNTPKFAVSFMKTMYGDAATKQNGWAFDYLPKVDRDYSWTNLWDDMYNGSDQRHVRLWDERRSHRAGFQQKHRRAEKSGFRWWLEKFIRTRPANSGGRRG